MKSSRRRATSQSHNSRVGIAVDDSPRRFLIYCIRALLVVSFARVRRAHEWFESFCLPSSSTMSGQIVFHSRLGSISQSGSFRFEIDGWGNICAVLRVLLNILGALSKQNGRCMHRESCVTVEVARLISPLDQHSDYNFFLSSRHFQKPEAQSHSVLWYKLDVGR